MVIPCRQRQVVFCFGDTYKYMLKMLFKGGAQELFEKRELSRDILAIIYDIVDVFSELCDELDQRQYGANLHQALTAKIK